MYEHAETEDLYYNSMMTIYLLQQHTSVVLNIMATQVLLKKPTFYVGPNSNQSFGKIKPPKINLNENDLAEAITNAMPKCGGVFELDLGNVVAPFEAMKDLFEKMENEPEIGQRANFAYTKNLVYKVKTNKFFEI